MLLKPYKTIADIAVDEFVEKRSRFIGSIMPVTTEQQALEFISELKSKYWDATHNVYAYILRDGQIKRYSDDGEPQGTAGVPVLDVLQKEGLTDVAIVVTRYFGGILLGGGGLVRAYSHCAKLAVNMAQFKIMTPCTAFELEFDYSLYGKINYILPKYNAVTIDSEFGALVKMNLIIGNDAYMGFCKELRELTSDLTVPVYKKELFYNMA
ncbi:MAG: YigZ family protein [Oscillospiraceae bacterium]